ncbi:putative SAM-dependent methyltransferase [Pedobacter sp. UYP24]
MKSLRKAVRSLIYIPIDKWRKTQLRSKIKTNVEKLQIIIGAHNTDYDSWLPTNIESLNLLQIDSFKYLFGDKKATRFLAEHVFEHISYHDALIALKNCYQYLEKGGSVRIAVPDGFHPNPEYINMVKPGGFGEGAHDHKLLYDYKKLSAVFEEAGFTPSLLEYYDESGKFHFTEWDSKDGHVIRSKRYDKRFKEPLGYSSLIIDGIKD